MSALHDLSAVEQVQAIACRQLSARELTAHYLNRIERLDGPIRAFITVLAEHALSCAERADQAVVGGVEAGPLHGLPLALKDLHPAAGLPTTFGSAALATMVPTSEGAAIANLRSAGAVIIGKTNTPEFGPTCYTDSKVGGTTNNPYDLRLTPSGSSGGAAAAVAAGLVGIAHGSDGLGSIRTPAAACGLVGFKSSRGRTAGSGAGFLALAVEGPLARTVGDTALFLDAMGPAAVGDLWRAPPRAPDAFRVAADSAPPAGLRVGRLVTPPLDVDVHDDCVAAVDITCERLRELGHEVIEVPPSRVPTTPEVRRAINVMLSASLSQVVELVTTPDQRHVLMPYTRWLIEQNTYTSTDYARAQAVLAGAAVRFREFLDDYDVVVTPTTTAPPPTTADLRADDGSGSLQAMALWSAFTPATNLAGTPGMSIPIHRTADGIPIGVQLLGGLFDDELLMSVAAQLEAAADWQQVHPPMWVA